jgi:hypothetical protein
VGVGLVAVCEVDDLMQKTNDKVRLLAKLRDECQRSASAAEAALAMGDGALTKLHAKKAREVAELIEELEREPQ